MKKPLLLVSLFYVIHSFGQSYVPLVDEAYTWKEQVTGWGVNPYTYWFSGDTLLDGNIYHKLYSFNDPFPEQIYFYGSFREDVEEQRVYRWFGDQEKLIYDFSVEQGEVVTTYPQGDPLTATVVSVDTEVVNGESRKQIHFDFGWYSDEWVVGRGSSLGLTSPFSNFPDFTPQLNCFYVGNDLAWSNPLFEGDCALQLGVVDQVWANQVYMGPNPASSDLYLFFGNASSGEKVLLQMISITGELVNEQSVSTAGFVHIELPQLPDGVYFLRVLTPEEVIGTLPVVIRQ